MSGTIGRHIAIMVIFPVVLVIAVLVALTGNWKVGIGIGVIGWAVGGILAIANLANGGRKIYKEIDRDFSRMDWR